MDPLADRIAQLGPDERALLRTMFDLRMNVSDAGARLNLTPDQAKKRASRARASLGAHSTSQAARMLAEAEGRGTPSASTMSALPKAHPAPHNTPAKAGDNTSERSFDTSIPTVPGHVGSGSGPAVEGVREHARAALDADSLRGGTDRLEAPASGADQPPPQAVGRHRPVTEHVFRLWGGRNDLTPLQRLIAIPLVAILLCATMIVCLSFYFLLQNIIAGRAP